MSAPPLIGPPQGRSAPMAAVTVLDRVADLRAHLHGARAAHRQVALVPTMGSLHEGHLSLVRRAAAECDLVAVTIFVNPLQFGSSDDLHTYPRQLDADVALASAAGAAVVFAPSVAEMYPMPPGTAVTVGALGEIYEGASRPGHFAGVATVVTKLFHAAGPCRAYFGEKDWQQLLVVRRMVDDLFFPVEVVACPTVREPDGLACSSRNVRLSPDERRASRVLFEALTAAAAMMDAGERDSAVVERRMAEVVAREPLANVDYAVAVQARALTPLETLTGDVRLLVAAHVGATRLIDNLGVTPTASGRP